VYALTSLFYFSLHSEDLATLFSLNLRCLNVFAVCVLYFAFSLHSEDLLILFSLKITDYLIEINLSSFNF
jgi:hypothetical protein